MDFLSALDLRIFLEFPATVSIEYSCKSMLICILEPQNKGPKKYLESTGDNKSNPFLENVIY